MSKSMVKRLEAQLADEPRDKLLRIIADQQARLDAAEKENAFSRKWIRELRDNPLHAMLLERIQELMQSDPPADSPDGIGLSVLAALCEAYEKRVVEKHVPPKGELHIIAPPSE